MRPDQKPDMTAAVTGATGAIGEAAALQLANLGYRVVLIARNEEKTASLADRIIRETGNSRISYRLADISRESHIKSLSSSWEGELHILINNAAASPPVRQETPEGIELQFATNVLGYFWMTSYFSQLLASSSPSRIVNVASYWAGGLDLSDLEFKRRPYHNHDAYRQSKQANRMLTPVFADRLASLGITVNACHPGDVNSKLSNDLGFGGNQSPAAGAKTPVWLATSEDLSGISGKYFEDQKETPCRFASETEKSKDLFDICIDYTQFSTNLIK